MKSEHNGVSGERPMNRNDKERQKKTRGERKNGMKSMGKSIRQNSCWPGRLCAKNECGTGEAREVRGTNGIIRRLVKDSLGMLCPVRAELCRKRK